MVDAKSDSPPSTRPRPAPSRERFRELSDKERRHSLEAALADLDDGREVWVFGYGSLMWNPCFDFDYREFALLEDHRRSFCIWTVIARGTPERPGLGLGLRAGGGLCGGMIYRLVPERLGEGLAALWDREMVTGIYRPAWVTAQGRKASRRCLTFVVNETHEQFAGEMPPLRAAEIIATAAGRYGHCADYLAETVRALEAANCPDRELAALLEKVEAFME